MKRFASCARRVIFPGRRQPSIVTVNELNYCVRNGNRCTLITINTHYIEKRIRVISPCNHTAPLSGCQEKVGDPWGNRTPVCGVRGRRLNRLTNGPFQQTSQYLADCTMGIGFSPTP